MLSSEGRIQNMPDGWIYCSEESEYNNGIYRMKSPEGTYHYWHNYKQEVEEDGFIKIIETPILIQQPKGYYCRDCYVEQHKSEYDLIHPDGETVKFWTQCKNCKIASKRSYAAKKWTRVLRELDPTMKNIRFATLTMMNPRWKLHNVGTFSEHLSGNVNAWEEPKDKEFLQWFNEKCGEGIIRKFTTKDGTVRYKWKGYIPELIQQTDTAMRRKLKLRLKNMRHKHKRFMNNVKGGIVAYESTINIIPETKEIELNPHLHAILHGNHYWNTREKPHLQEDWGLGMCDIKEITDPWKVQLEVAKYVGKDGSRRTAWGTIRKIRSKMLENERESRLNSSDSLPSEIKTQVTTDHDNE